MKNLTLFIKRITERLLRYQNSHTPKPDKLAHYYWGDLWFASLGSIIALVVLFLLHQYLAITNKCYLLAALPTICSLIAGCLKEKRDLTGLGSYELQDVWFTVKPSISHSVYLIIIISILK